MRITTRNVYLERQKSAYYIVEIIEGQWVQTDGQFVVNDSAARLAGTTHTVIILPLTPILVETAIKYSPPSLPAPRLRYVPLACLNKLLFVVTAMLYEAQ